MYRAKTWHSNGVNASKSCLPNGVNASTFCHSFGVNSPKFWKGDRKRVQNYFKIFIFILEIFFSFPPSKILDY